MEVWLGTHKRVLTHLEAKWFCPLNPLVMEIVCSSSSIFFEFWIDYICLPRQGCLENFRDVVVAEKSICCWKTRSPEVRTMFQKCFTLWYDFNARGHIDSLMQFSSYPQAKASMADWQASKLPLKIVEVTANNSFHSHPEKRLIQFLRWVTLLITRVFIEIDIIDLILLIVFFSHALFNTGGPKIQ